MKWWWAIAVGAGSAVLIECREPQRAAHSVSEVPADASLSGDPSGQWRGYIEHMDFGDGAGTVTLRFGAGDGAASGSVVFGTRVDDIDDLGNDAGQRDIGVVAGFAYTLHRVRAEDGRLRFLIETGDAAESWCAEQRPRKRLEGTDAFGCPRSRMLSGERCFISPSGGRLLPDAGFEREASRREPIPVDCELFGWCAKLQSLCDCSEDGCAPRPGSRYEFDLTIRADVADGSIQSPHGMHNVHLKRVSP